jgi:hypothetical protein
VLSTPRCASQELKREELKVARKPRACRQPSARDD